MIRKEHISEEVRSWLKKSQTVVSDFDIACIDVAAEIESNPNVSQIKTATKIIVKVIESRTCLIGIIETFIKVYAVIERDTWFRKAKKTIISLDESGKLEKVRKIPNKYRLSINGGDFVEEMATIKEKQFEFFLKD